MSGKKTYLVGVDGSECSMRAAKSALEFAQETGARVVFAHAVWMTGTEVGLLHEGGYYGLPHDYARVNEENRDTLFAELDDMSKDSGVEISKVSEAIPPVDFILRQIDELKPTMVFLGRQGRSAFGDILVGSVSNRLAHIVKSPVTLVP